MIMLVLFLLIGIAIMGAGVYAYIHSRRMTKNAPINAVVMECNASFMTIMKQELPCFEITIDVRGPYGSVYKTMKVRNQYEPGDVIKVCYDPDSDKVDLPQNVDQSKGKGPLVLIIFGAIWTAIIGLVMYMTIVPEASDFVGSIIAAFMCLVFVGVGGYLSILGPIKRKKELPNCYVTEGRMVDYLTKRSRSNGKTNTLYTPIYEYYYHGQVRTYESTISSNSSKHRQIGRVVTIVENPYTGKVYCKEDEASSSRLGFVFFVVGILILGVVIHSMFQSSGETASGKYVYLEDGRKIAANEDGFSNEYVEMPKELEYIEYYYLPDEISGKRYGYMIRIYEGYVVQVSIYPTKSMGKMFNQFYVMNADEERVDIAISNVIGNDMEKLIGEDEQDNTIEESIHEDIYYYDGEERVGSSGYNVTSKVFKAIVKDIKDCVPMAVWSDIELQMDEYYSK